MLLYSLYAGSRLYGLASKTSDYDMRGVFLEPPHIFFSLDTLDYYEDTVSDTVMYSLRKFIKLALNNNPNTLELLFAPWYKHIIVTEEWKQIYAIRHKFLSQKAIKAYKGFILSEYDRWNKMYDLDQQKQNKIAAHIYRLSYNLAQIVSIQDFNPSLGGKYLYHATSIKCGVYSREFIIELINAELQYIDSHNPTGHLPIEPEYDSINLLITSIQTKILTQFQLDSFRISW